MSRHPLDKTSIILFLFSMMILVLFADINVHGQDAEKEGSAAGTSTGMQSIKCISPENGSVTENISITLVWSPANSAIAYNVYFSTGNPPKILLKMYKKTAYKPPRAAAYQTWVNKSDYPGGMLKPGTKYYWKIDAITENFVIEGPVWHFITPLKPGARDRHHLISNNITNTSYLFAGDGAISPKFEDLWSWDGKNWKLLGIFPKSRSMPGITFDEERDQLVLFGGVTFRKYSNHCNIYNDTWIYDKDTWKEVIPLASPPARWYHCMVYDRLRKKVLLYGGINKEDKKLYMYNDMWEWNGKTWTELKPKTMPPKRTGQHIMVFDSSRNVIVLFGGVGEKMRMELGDTWEWDGKNWIEKKPKHNPPARLDHAMAYDPLRKKTVLYGGKTQVRGNFGRKPYRDYQDTWEWDGTDWTEIKPKVNPSVRNDHAMCFDPKRKTVLLHGGDQFVGWARKLSVKEKEDVWEWNGKNWKLVLPLKKSEK